MANNRQFNVLDGLAIWSAMIGYLNFEENVSQSQMQDTVNDAINTIQGHLEMQDKKLDLILERIGGSINDK